MKVYIATTNAGKIEGAKLAFSQFFKDFEIEGFKTESDVSEQPLDGETLQGAKNRVNNLKKYAKENNLSADYYVAIESGLINLYGQHFIINFAVIEGEGKVCYGTSCGFPIANRYVQTIKDKGLADFMDDFFFEDQDRRNDKGGTGMLTQDNYTRIDLNKQAFTMALTQIINENWSD